MLDQRIDEANIKLGNVERIIRPRTEKLTNNLRMDDHVFRYHVNLYGRRWT